MNQHTPGPWKHDEIWGLIKHGKQEIAALHSGNVANAKLISAAPDLLQSLKMAANFIESGESSGFTFFEVREAWRNAIQKATGGAS